MRLVSLKTVLAGLVVVVALALVSAPAFAAPPAQGNIRPVQKIWMSASANGDPVSVFPSGAKSAFVVFDYKDAADVEIQVRVIDPKGQTIMTETKKYSGAGRENLELKPSDPLGDGAYITNVYVGLQGSLFLSETNEWNVGNPPPAQPTAAAGQAAQAAPPAGQPASAQAAQPPAAQPPAQSSSNVAAPAAAGSDTGLSAPMLIGAGVLVVGLLALVVWAVRGFLGAPKAS